MGSLALINLYDSSDEEEENVPVRNRLPQPILPSYDAPRSITRAPDQNNDQDQLRVRNFPHEAGNWATFLAIPVRPPPEMEDLIESLLSMLDDLPLFRVDDWHVSLTRVVVLRHHWINEFVSSVRQVIIRTNAFPITLQGLSVYRNDNNTTTFIAINVKSGSNSLSQVVNQLDQCLAEYDLPKFYETHSFHMSLLWGAGDLSERIEACLNKLEFENINQFIITKNVTNCFCKTGNKFFDFQFSRQKIQI